MGHAFIWVQWFKSLTASSMPSAESTPVDAGKEDLRDIDDDDADVGEEGDQLFFDDQ